MLSLHALPKAPASLLRPTELTAPLQFRMSMKSDKSDIKPHHISIPTKDAISIVPPKKVRSKPSSPAPHVSPPYPTPQRWLETLVDNTR